MINSQSISDLKSDLEYLIYEAEALKPLISEIPFQEKPLGGKSVIEILVNLNKRQKYVFELIKKSASAEKVGQKDIEAVYSPEVELSEEEIESLSVDSILHEIISLRKEIFLYINEKPDSFFEVEVAKTHQVFDIFSNLVEEERSNLKEIGELVMAYQTDRQFQREISK